MGGAVLGAAARGDVGRLASLLRADARHIDVTDENGCSAIQRAAADGHVEAVALLLQHGADPNRQDHVHGNTAAHEAAWKGYSKCVAVLASAGADLGLRNAGGFAPLHLACQNGHNQSCREILLAGGQPDLQNNYGDTSLHTAARYGHAGVTRILISAQCRVSEQNKNGDTALHIAAAMGRRKLTRILLEAGCEKSLRNQQGETARDIAARKGLYEIINILDSPVAKAKKKDKNRDKSKDRNIDEPDEGKKNDKTKSKKKKNVHFENEPPQVQWSPYGCHYYPDPKYFPKPKLSSLPTEPLKKGEQYYLDLAGNIKKGPIGAGYTCYCAPFFKHMEDKLNTDKKDLKLHIDRAHDRLDQKVTDLEMKTQGKISELTRFVAAERALCEERHLHLEQWLTRGIMFRASERPRRLDFSPRGSLDIAPLKRTRSLEVLDSRCEKVNSLIGKFDNDNENVQTNINTKDLHNTKRTSKSTEVLDNITPPTLPSRTYNTNKSKSSDQLDSAELRTSYYPTPKTPLNISQRERNKQNVTAEIHVNANRVSLSQSPISVELQGYIDRCISPSHSNTKSPSICNRLSDHKASDIEDTCQPNIRSPSHVPAWNKIPQRTNEMRMGVPQISSRQINNINIMASNTSNKTNTNIHNNVESTPQKSVQELVAQVEYQQKCTSPENPPCVDKSKSQLVNSKPTSGILKMPQQLQRPAPILKEKQSKTKRFSLHNLIPFPSRKSFQTSTKDKSNDSESSDEEDNPVRTANQPGPMRNLNLLQTVVEMEGVTNKPQSPAPQTVTKANFNHPHDMRIIPKDAYFHEIPNRRVPQTYHTNIGLPQSEFNRENVLQNPIYPRNRNPLYHQTGVFDAMMQDHILREMERIPHSYSDQLDQNTEIEIANENRRFRDYYNNNQVYESKNEFITGHNSLQSRLQSLAVNTNLADSQSQVDRESHNDSGYSTKVYGSSQGPSPSLSGHVDSCDNFSGQRVNVMSREKGLSNQMATSSLV